MLNSINQEQRLYVLKSGDGYSCLGFDVAEKRRKAYCEWLGSGASFVAAEVGTVAAFNAYNAAQSLVFDRYKQTGKRCDAELTPALVGLEGKRVEVVSPDGTKERFIVGKSTGWIPIHLAIKTRRSTGGGAAYIPKGATVRVVG